MVRSARRPPGSRHCPAPRSLEYGGTVTISHDADVITAGSCANRYSINRNYHPKDVCGNTTSKSHTITVDDETGPVIGTFPNDTTVSCASGVPAADDGSVTATDACGGTVTISHDADVITAGSCANRYSITRTYHAKDVCGNTTSKSQTITVDDETGPVIGTFPNDTTVSCASGVPAADDGSVTATDACGGTVTISHDADVIPAGRCPNPSSITRTYHAKDVCGNTTSKSQTITVDDETGPVISTFPNDTTVSCASGVPAADDGSVTATDACGGTVSLSHHGEVITAGRFAQPLLH